ncbi:hypothetical protein [Parvularcula sp. IMCC14364]|uniref:hypothetical protein n=1 Tax=Parvularcula sp. IMCC14364 TaxID=3067902 RepID=UPI0027410ABF|nr:hypothetical protein [Parvularcula sp. IMCC14364]
MILIRQAVTVRFGLYPDFFRVLEKDEAALKSVFDEAHYAYLDAPFPSLWKEKLFTYLSLFTENKYCVLRHAAFLTGHGYPSGDRDCGTMAQSEVRDFLLQPLPDFSVYASYLEYLEKMPTINAWPEDDSLFEEAVFWGAVSAFLKDGPYSDFKLKFRRILGETFYSRLMSLLAFIQSAHFWAELNAEELSIEPDAEELLRKYPDLELVLRDRYEALLSRDRTHAGAIYGSNTQVLLQTLTTIEQQPALEGGEEYDLGYDMALRRVRGIISAARKLLS